MALSFSQGLLSSLTNPSFGGNLGTIGQQIGGLGGQMRANEQKALQEQGQQSIQAMGLQGDLSNPETLASMQAVAQQTGLPTEELNKLFTDTLAMRKSISDLNAEKQRIQQQGALRESLASRWEAVGNVGEAESLRTGVVDVEESQKDLRDAEITQVLNSRGTAGRKAIALRAGLTVEEFNTINAENPSDEQFKAIIQAQEAELKPFLDATGKPQMFKVNRFGDALDPTTQTFKSPHELGLAPAPQLSRVTNIGDNLAKGLANEAIKNFGDLNTAAKQATQTLATNEQSRLLLEEGINTGLLAGAKTDLQRLYIAFGGDPAQTNVAATQNYITSRIKETGRFIEAFGAGSGLSDTDREYASAAVGGNISLEEDALKRLLEIERHVAESVINDHGTILNKMSEQGIDKATLELFSLPSRVSPSLPSKSVNSERPQDASTAESLFNKYGVD